MSRRYYKTTLPNGFSFRGWPDTVQYSVGETVCHPRTTRWSEMVRDRPSTYLSVATVPTDCVGMVWPCRLFAVEGIGRPVRSDLYPNKRGFRAVRVVEELPAHMVFGPQGEQVVALLERASKFGSLAARLRRVGPSVFPPRAYVVEARWALSNASRNAGAVLVADIAFDHGYLFEATVWGLLARDLIGRRFTQEHYDALTRAWRLRVGPLHPDDPPLAPAGVEA